VADRRLAAVTEERTPRRPRFQVLVPDELQGGAYANALNVWHTAHEFTLDFGATLPAERRPEGVVVPIRVAARVKVPPSVLFEMIRAINENMTRYESVFGRIEGPSSDEPLVPPDDLLGGSAPD
jgi:hypothetical protein